MSKKTKEEATPVVAACIISKNKFLLSQRTLVNHPDCPHAKLMGAWEFPGGVPEPGEDLKAAVVREVKEELGLAIYVKVLIHAQINSYEDKDYLVLYYACRPVKSPDNILLLHSKWLDLRMKAKLNVLPGTFEAITALVNRRYLK